MALRSQKRKNNHQESIENVSENLVSPVFVENEDLREQDVMVAGTSRAE